MQIIFVIPSFIIFLYALFRLVKDDHVFFRRNIKLEHFFDYAILSSLTSWIFLQIFSIHSNEKVTISIFIASLTLFIIAKYKKIPVGRFFDFFSLSFLISIPVWYLIQGFFSKSSEKIIFFVSSVVYFLIASYFTSKLFPKIMNRTMREGSLSIFFIVFYSFYSILISIFSVIYNNTTVLSAGNVVLILMLIASVPLLIRAQR